MRHTWMMVDISDKRNSGFGIAVRDKDGELRSPTAEEFHAIRTREKHKNLRFTYVSFYICIYIFFFLSRLFSLFSFLFLIHFFGFHFLFLFLSYLTLFQVFEIQRSRRCQCATTVPQMEKGIFCVCLYVCLCMLLFFFLSVSNGPYL